MRLLPLFLVLSGLHAQCPAEVAAPAPAPAPAPPEEEIPDDGTRVSILGYHDFSEELPETEMRINTSKFRRQMETIRQLDLTVISLAEFAAWKTEGKPIPERSILLTIDDGWKSVYTDAFPILTEFEYPFTLYLYKNYVDGGNKALTTPMIREMVESGATIGSHSISHPYPATIRGHQRKGPDAIDAFLRREMGESRRFLEDRFKVTVDTYAYPGGFFLEEMLPLVEEIGYRFAFTVQPAKVRRPMPDHQLPRYMILGTHDRIFEYATNFGGAATVATPQGAITGLFQETAHPVGPEAGAVVNSRMPEIAADLSAVEDIDPATVVMKVSGFGPVPATFSAETGRLAWQVNRPLRHPTCQVSVTWKDQAGKAPESPLHWTFRIDREAAYLPED